MKFVLMFLSVCLVTVSHQQFHQQRPRGQLWWLPYHQPFPIDREDNAPFHPQLLLRRPHKSPILFLTEEVGMRAESNRFVDIEPKNKYGERTDVMQQDPRYLINILSRKSQLSATATFTITSTCTSLRISTCVPRANFRPVAPAVIPNCRRKKQLQSDANQFSIVPTQVHSVVTTERPMPSESQMVIASSMEEDAVQTADEQEAGRRMGRFLYYLLSKSNSVASTTITTWSVVSSTLTQTFVPAANFFCVPPSTIICPAAAGK